MNAGLRGDGFDQGKNVLDPMIELRIQQLALCLGSRFLFVAGIAVREDQISEITAHTLLARELHAAEPGSEDYEKLHEVVRQLAVTTNSVLFRMASNRIAAQIPPGSFADVEDEPDGDPFEGQGPIDFRIGLQGKKNPAG